MFNVFNAIVVAVVVLNENIYIAATTTQKMTLSFVPGSDSDDCFEIH